MPNEGRVPTFSRGTAISVINAMRLGVPVADPDALRFLTVGQEPWHASMRTLLDEVRDFDVSTLRIVSGEYGDGKSHFMALVAAEALARTFVVARLVAEKTPLHKFEDVWKAVLEAIETPADRGRPGGIRGLLDAWCEAADGRVPEALVGLDKVRGIDPSFRVALRLYLQAHLDDGDHEPILQWLSGGTVRPKGIANRVDKSTAHVMLRSLTKFIKHAGYSGVVLVFDELEHIMEQTVRIRTNSYESIRQFVDSASNPESLVWLGACTPNLITDQRGFSEYPALSQRLGRLAAAGASAPLDFRGTLIHLGQTPLSQEDLLALASGIRAVHSLARGWDASTRVTDTVISRAVAIAATGDFLVATPRLLVQYFASTLEIAHQNPGLDIARTIERDIMSAVTTVQEQEDSRFKRWE